MMRKVYLCHQVLDEMCHPPLLQLNGLLMPTNCSMKCVIQVCCNLYVQICNYINRYCLFSDDSNLFQRLLKHINPV
ncbi:hypothetical protein HanPSC8_Chr01g0023081 [Helianthus annuus]|nr:hypothetical protein HanPSC8_Chr01g0023081 [Helianthus annuus]